MIIISGDPLDNILSGTIADDMITGFAGNASSGASTALT